MSHVPNHRNALPVPAPWTPEQQSKLQEWQDSDFVHPFTCKGNRGDDAHRARAEATGEVTGQLIPTHDGWVCPVCYDRQSWAWDFMFKGPPDKHTPARTRDKTKRENHSRPVRLSIGEVFRLVSSKLEAQGFQPTFVLGGNTVYYTYPGSEDFLRFTVTRDKKFRMKENPSKTVSRLTLPDDHADPGFLKTTVNGLISVISLAVGTYFINRRPIGVVENVPALPLPEDFYETHLILPRHAKYLEPAPVHSKNLD